MSSWLLLPNGEKVELTATNLVGRSQDCTIFLPGQKVSRRHAHIYELKGDFFVVDTQSNNGTYLNETRLHHPAKLQDGDRIRIGDHQLLFISLVGSHPPDIAPAYTATGERTTLAIREVPAWLLLADIRGSTQLIHELGSAEYARTVGIWFHRCRQIVEMHHGIVNKSTGDGLLAYWIDEDQDKAPLTLRVLIRLRELNAAAPPSFRCVLHHGMVNTGGAARKGEEALSGREVHYLFRLEQAVDRALDWVLSESAGRRLEALCPIAPLASMPIKGFDREAQLFRPILDQEPSGETPPSG